jgi:hypothetical protein
MMEDYQVGASNTSEWNIGTEPIQIANNIGVKVRIVVPQNGSVGGKDRQRVVRVGRDDVISVATIDQDKIGLSYNLRELQGSGVLKHLRYARGLNGIVKRRANFAPGALDVTPIFWP